MSDEIDVVIEGADALAKAARLARARHDEGTDEPSAEPTPGPTRVWGTEAPRPSARRALESAIEYRVQGVLRQFFGERADAGWAAQDITRAALEEVGKSMLNSAIGHLA